MKIIDLLNKIANDEEVPKKIKIETHIFTKYNYPMGDGTFVSSYGSNNDGEYESSCKDPVSEGWPHSMRESEVFCWNTEVEERKCSQNNECLDSEVLSKK